MTDEVASDDIADRLAQEIPRDVVRGIMRDVVELFRCTFVADKEVEADERAAMRDVASISLKFVTSAASRLRGHPGFPAEMPGAALKLLVAVLTDLSDDKVDPILRNNKKAVGRPTLPLSTQLERLEHAVAMELLMAKDPQSPVDAAKEVLDLLRDSLAEALVRQWRRARAGGDTAETFNAMVQLAKREVGVRGLTADAYSKVIRTTLIPKR
jgi:hypothetical protein